MRNLISVNDISGSYWIWI